MPYMVKHVMRLIRGLVPMGALLPLMGVAAELSASEMLLPQGIEVRLTIEGPVFVDDRGMTLYRLTGSSSGSSCDNRIRSVLLQSEVDFPVAVPDVENRRTCVQKRPPLRAPSNAQAIGQWTVHTREDGSRQWAYAGEPLYTSIKDKAPGETNGVSPAWAIALAPLIGTPPGITMRKTAVGLALADSAGKTLYYPDRAESGHADIWHPLTASALNFNRLPDWSVITRPDGLRQWVYRGKPLYTYRDDSDTAGNRVFSDTFGGMYGRRIDGWNVAVLKEAPARPADVTTTTIIEWDLDQNPSARRVYADAKGMTLYTIHCVENTEDRLDCDDVGDSPRYWLNFCGGIKRCQMTWRPLAAPADTEFSNEIWSVITINPDHPWRAIEKGTPGVTVWAYKGRPVLTYAHDLRQGDYNGSGLGLARSIEAFDTDAGRARPRREADQRAMAAPNLASNLF